MLEKSSLEQTDEELVQLTLKDKEIFRLLVERYQAKLTRYVARLGVANPEDQMDVVQEIFIKVYKNLNGFNTTLSFSSWVYRIAHNEAITWYRKVSVRPEGHLVVEGDDIVALISSKEEAADVLFDQGINAEELTKGLFEIDSKYTEVLILRYFEHKEYEEISDILKIPIGSVGTLIHRGKKQLATVLNKEIIRI